MSAVKLDGVTWKGPKIDDQEILRELPEALRELLGSENGFVLHGGALHVRGACLAPDWHSLRTAWRGEEALHKLYGSMQPDDVPFAQDIFGDQFILRDEVVMRLFAESGEVEKMAEDLDEFLAAVNIDLEAYLNVQPGQLEPGQLLLAYPPFCFEEAGAKIEFSPLPASEVIQFHAKVAAQLKDVPEGAKIEFKIDADPS
jgi:hypothetical protein